MNTQAAVAQIDKLLGDYQTLRSKSKYEDISDFPDESKTIVVRLRAALDRLVPGENSYTREMARAESDPVHIRIRVYVGILSAFKGDLIDGWVEGVAGFSEFTGDWAEPNSSFTSDEIKLIEERLTSIEGYLIEQVGATKQLSDDIHTEFKWLKGELKSQGRKAWLMLFVGTVWSKIADWGLSSIHLDHIYQQLVIQGAKVLSRLHN